MMNLSYIKDKIEHNYINDVINACVEHSWNEHGPYGRDGYEGRYAKHGINTKQELKEYIEYTIFNNKTKCFKSHDNREIYIGPKNEKGYSAEVILNYNRDKNGKYYGGTCYPTDRPNELSRLARQETRQNANIPPLILEGGFYALHPELRKDLEQGQALGKGCRKNVPQIRQTFGNALVPCQACFSGFAGYNSV